VRVLLPEARRVLCRGRCAGGRRDGLHRARDRGGRAGHGAQRSIAALHGARGPRPAAGTGHARLSMRGGRAPRHRPGARPPPRLGCAISANSRRSCSISTCCRCCPPGVEPQDVPPHLRHYFTTEASWPDRQAALRLRARHAAGADSFEMLQDSAGLSDEEFARAHATRSSTPTRRASPLDIPDGAGADRFRPRGQLSIVTPFTLMGAMAPITVAGAITLSHAEALAGDHADAAGRPGAPVMYGTFTSNVDMKSGAPAFGTPEHFKASLAAGQTGAADRPALALRGRVGVQRKRRAGRQREPDRALGLPAGGGHGHHPRGRLAGGRADVSYEKLITDMESAAGGGGALRRTPPATTRSAFERAARGAAAGPFLRRAHTMERYRPSSTRRWWRTGRISAPGRSAAASTPRTRATNLAEDPGGDAPGETRARPAGGAEAFIDRRTAEGGAPPES
jgi:trimethylamine--corrinoid protein Co-methyltransferase